MDAIPAVAGLLGRARKRPAKLHADKGYDYKRCRAYLRQRGIASRIAWRGVESSEKLGNQAWISCSSSQTILSAGSLGLELAFNTGDSGVQVGHGLGLAPGHHAKQLCGNTLHAPSS